MNPYTLLINPLHATPRTDARLLNDDTLDNSVSHAAYRIADSVDRLLFRRGR